MEVLEKDKEQENVEMVKIFDPNDCQDSENKPEKRLKIGDHYLVRRSNNTWRKYEHFYLLI